MQAFIPIQVISLRRATERRSRIAQQMTAIGAPFVFIDAVDGKDMSAADIAALDPRYIARANRSQWLPGELGNRASFHRVMKGIAQGQSEFVCVLEDDAILTRHFVRFVSAPVLRDLPRFDVLRFESSWVGRYLPVTHLDGIEIVAPYRLGPLACAQVFTREAARKILTGMVPSHGPLDLTLYMDRRYPALRILDVMPEVVHHPADSSFIEGPIPRVADAKSVRDRVRSRLFRAGYDLRTAVSFAILWGPGARGRMLRRAPHADNNSRSS